MTIRGAMINSKYGIFRLKAKTPEIWEKRICLFDSLEEAKKFWENNGMAISMRNPIHGLYIFKLIDGCREEKPYDYPKDNA